MRTIDRLLMLDLLKRDELDEEIWRSTEEGKHYKLETETGEIKAGFGGKLNGQKIKPKGESSPSGEQKTRSTAQTSGREPNNSQAESEFIKSLKAKRTELLQKSPARQARFVYEQGFVDLDTAVKAMNEGTAKELANAYFDLLEHSGDYTPTKPLSGDLSRQLDKDVKEGKYDGDYTKARIGYIENLTGQDPEQAKATLKQFDTWFGGSWDRADTKTLDTYIEQDSAYDGEIYRGMHFEEDEYQAFMKDIAVGKQMGMNGKNSSWTNDREVAWLFSVNGDRHVIIHCMKNRTAAPVSHLSTHGEDEVLAHSKTRWTVLNVQEGTRRTEITVIEAGKYGDGTNDRAPGMVQDAAPEKDAGLQQRMAAQSKYMKIYSDSFADELAEKYPFLRKRGG